MILKTHKKIPRILPILILAQIVILAAAFVWMRRGVRKITPIELSISDWTCQYSIYQDGAFSVEGDIQNSGEEITFLYGPGIPLKKGTYASLIEYEAEFDQSCMASGTNAVTILNDPADFIKASPGRLSSSKNSVIYRFEVPENVQKFNLNISYNGKGFFRIKNISLQQTGTYYRRTAATIFFLCVFVDALYLFSGLPVSAKKKAALILGIGLAASIPLFFRRVGELNTSDMQFHLIRIDVLANAIRDRQFPPRISTLWMDGYGFPASIYYNDILLLFPALLRLLGYDLVISMKAYLLCMNIITAAISVWAFTAIFGNRKTGILCAVSYVLAPFRLGDIYAQAAVGEFSAMAFLPLAAYGVVKMYTEDPSDLKKYIHYGLVLALGISGVAASHTLSLVLTVFFMALVFLFQLRKSLRKNTLLLWMGTAILSLLLNACFLVPFADYYFNVDTLIRENAAVGGAAMMQYHGISLGRLLSFFPDAFDPVGYRVLTPGLVLTAAFCLGVYQIVKIRNARLKIYLILSAIALILSMDCFPWNFLEAHTFFGRTLAMIQYPYRFMILADLLLCLVLGELCCVYADSSTGVLEKARKCALFLNVLYLIVFVNNFSTGVPAEYKYETASLDTFLTSLHYLPVGASTDRYAYKNSINSDNAEKAFVVSQKTHTTEIHVESSSGGTVEVPVLNYRYYHVYDMDGNEYEVRNGTNCRISFDLPAGFNGNLKIEFQQPWFWQAAFILSLISFVLLFSVFTVGKSFDRKKRKGS
ncbi:MAG: hypothetical protein IJI14_19200 [Anaerolineaceae bacterium]|nr:hypothetical protein [Anaerolineaceae bacterium]